MTVKLPDSKREAFSLRASAFMSSSPRSLKEVRETCGALQHVASMAQDLAPFLAELFAFMKAWETKEPYHRLHVPAQVQDEAKVWVRALRHEMVRSIAVPSKEFPHVLYVDASTTWGVGVTCDDQWAAWMLLSGWDADGTGIGWAEAAALELGVRQAVAMGASDCVLRIFSDNKGVIGAFRKGRSRGRSANSIMRSLIAFAMQHHLDVRVTYVATDPPFDPSFMPHGDIKWYQKQLREEDKARYPRTRRQGAASLAGNISGRHPTPTHRALRKGSSSSSSSSSSHSAALQQSSISKSLSASALTSLALVGRPQPLKVIKTSKPSSIGKKPLARDRIMTIAPISGDNPGLKTTSGFDFDPQGCHWHAVHQILASSLEASTRANYGAGIDHFIDFCNESGIAHRHRYPVSQGLLLAFVAHMSDKVRASTLSNYITGIATWHRTWNQPFERGEAVGLALRALSKSGPLKLPPRPPVTPEELMAVFRVLDVAGNAHHAAVWACALVSWWSMCRLGETTTANLSPQADCNVMRSHFRGFSTGDSGHRMAAFWLPWTKTTKVQGLDKFVADCGEALNPVFVLRHHFRLSPHVPELASITSLFAFRERADKPLLPLTKKSFLETFNSALSAAGRGSHVGHSFRIGGATIHWRAGVPLDTIKLMGGWKSDSVLLYLRRLDLGLASAHALTAAFIGNPL